MGVTPTDDEIEEQLEAAYEQREAGGTRWPAMTFEEGVIAAIEWMAGDTEDAPMDDE